MKNALLEFFSNIISKSNKKFDHKEDVDDSNLLPTNEEPELPILNQNSVFYSIDFNDQFRNVKQLVRTYRSIALDHKIEDAIDEIINEAVVSEDNKNNININLDSIEDMSDGIKEKIIEEFKTLLNILLFKRDGSKLFRQWYIDGRLWFQILFHKNEKNGIAKLRKLSPLDITRIKDEKTEKIFYVYKEDEQNKLKRRQIGGVSSEFDRKFSYGVKITEENIIFVPSGITDPENSYFISHLHKSIKPLNQLRLLEDSAVIYRITRAPERRVFYIDVGKLPKTKAEAYVKSLMNKFKSSVTYDITTGKVSENKNVMTMLEDFYIPTRGDLKGTKVDTLPGGAQLGEIDDIKYFKKNLLSALKVPFSRLETDDSGTLVDFGKPGEITRPELKFQKFISRLRSDFSILFFELLKIQLITKGIIKVNDWNKIKNDIDFIWQSDSYFTELKEFDILSQRFDILDAMSDYIGKYYSNVWVRTNVLKQTEEDQKQIDKEIKQNNDDVPDEEEQDDVPDTPVDKKQDDVPDEEQDDVPDEEQDDVPDEEQDKDDNTNKEK